MVTPSPLSQETPFPHQEQHRAQEWPLSPYPPLLGDLSVGTPPGGVS